jgi:hypothetical protein
MQLARLPQIKINDFREFFGAPRPSIERSFHFPSCMSLIHKVVAK